MKTRHLLPALLLPLLATPARAACPMHPDAPPELSANHDCCRLAQEDWDAAVAAMAVSEESLFQVESVWENQAGDAAPLSQLAGRPQIVAMAYTSCQYACPRLFSDLKAIEATLAQGSGALPGFAVITFDPARDTPEQLRRHAAENQLDLARWTLLRGEPGDILEIANLLGVRYQALPDGEFSHSNIITLLSAKGEILAQINGLGADPAPLLEALEALR